MQGFTGEPRFYSGAELRNHFRCLIEGATKIDIATAWVSSSDILDLLLSQDTKTSIRIVVGVGGYSTDPVALKKLGSKPNVTLKIHGDAGSSPLFHPKLYIFAHQHFRRTLIGSMNFTRAGSTQNIESMLSMEDKQRSADKEFERFWTSTAALPFDQFDLAAYEEKRRQLLRAVKDAGAEGVLDSDVEATAESQVQTDALTEDWGRFIAELKAAPNNLDDYRRVLEVRRELVDRDWSKDLTKHDLDIMFGTTPYYAWGRLGTLRQNQGQFMGDANRPRRKQIEAALRSAAKLQHLERPIVEGIIRQLLQVRYCGGALATRLLVLARPDIFVVVNRKSFDGLQKRFGMIVSDVDFDPKAYVSLLERVHAQSWYRSPVPSDPFESEIWQARAAFIDPLVYTEKPGDAG